MNKGLTVKEKSVVPTSFGRGRLQGNLFSFEKNKWLQKSLFDIICLEIRHTSYTSHIYIYKKNIYLITYMYKIIVIITL